MSLLDYTYWFDIPPKPLIPTGVEHKIKREKPEPSCRPPKPLIPTGVEHCKRLDLVVCHGFRPNL